MVPGSDDGRHGRTRRRTGGPGMPMKSRKLRWTLIAVGLLVALVAFVLGPYELIRAWKIERDLKAVGPADAARAPEIAPLLDDYNPMVRGTAAQALGRIG